MYVILLTVKMATSNSRFIPVPCEGQNLFVVNKVKIKKSIYLLFLHISSIQFHSFHLG